MGAEQDVYAASSPTIEVSLASLNLSTIDEKYFRFLVTGKNAANTGQSLAIRVDYIKLIKV